MFQKNGGKGMPLYAATMSFNQLKKIILGPVHIHTFMFMAK